MPLVPLDMDIIKPGKSFTRGFYNSLSGGGSDFFNALSFNGVANNVTHTGQTISSGSDLTVSVWVNVSTALDAPIIIRGVSDANFIRLRLDTNQVRVYMSSVASDFNIPVSVVNNQWVHLGVSRISNNVRVYINSVESTTGPIINSNTFRIAGLSTYVGIELDGLIDEYAVLCNLGASALDFVKIWNNGKGRDFIDVMGSADVYLKMNEEGNDSVAIDSSGNGNDGILNSYIIPPSPWTPHT